MAADGGLRLVLLRPGDAVETSGTCAEVSESAVEVNSARPKAEKLGHNGIVIVAFGDMAIRTVPCRSHSAGGMRKMRVKSLPAVSFGGNSLLLGIIPFPVLVLRADNDCAGGPDDGQAVAFYSRI